AKARKAAELYSEVEIDALCALVEENRAPFAPTHLMRVLSVEDHKLRKQLTSKAVHGRWSVYELEAEIRQRCGRGGAPPAGRRPSMPPNRVGRLAYLARLCRRWCRWCQAVAPQLTPKLQKQIKMATRAITKLQHTVEEELYGRQAAPRARKR